MVKELTVDIKIKLGMLTFPSIPIFNYQKTLAQEVKENSMTRKECLSLLEQMLMIRTLEEMLVQISSGLYKPLPNYAYVEPTHLSIGQEAASAGSISAIGLNDYIISSHRGHGDAMAKGYSVIKNMDDESLRNLIIKRKNTLKQ